MSSSSSHNNNNNNHHNHGNGDDNNNNNNNVSIDVNMPASARNDSSRLASKYAREDNYFGFHPLLFHDDVRDAVFDYCQQGIQLIDKVVKEDNGFIGKNEMVDKATTQFYNLMSTAIESKLDQLEMYTLQNIFSIPSNLTFTKNQDTTTTTSHIDTSPISLDTFDTLQKETDQIDNEIKRLIFENEELKKRKQLLKNETDIYHTWETNLHQITTEKGNELSKMLHSVTTHFQELSQIVCVDIAKGKSIDLQKSSISDTTDIETTTNMPIENMLSKV